MDKNPDEFYHGMMSRTGPKADKWNNGTVPGHRGNKVLSQEAARLFKTQDLGYIRTVRNQTMKEVSKLEMAVKGIVGNGQKIVFVAEQEEELKEDDQDNEDDGDNEDNEHEEDNKDTREENSSVEDRRRQKDRCRQAEKLNARLTVARKRLATLTEAEQALEIQRAKMAKSPLVEGINKFGVKFRVKERKR